MPSIRVLPPHIANQIAAGEVVERPASVVKELIENALDARAKNITVHVKAGGKELISVTDDGIGMDREDLELSVERHATSKIKDEADLYAIKSLGFRGEALPSIGAVSDLCIKSAREGADSGWAVRVYFGRGKEVRPCPCPPGTTVEVKDLFLEIPARRRFLKSDAAELGHITRLVRVYAASFSEVSFRLVSGKREVFSSPKEKEGPLCLSPILGEEGLSSLLPIEGEGYGIRVTGFVSGPQVSTKGPRLCYFFLNRRPVSSRLLLKAVQEATRGELLKGEYPLLALFIEADPSLVDVNCHPTKQEVRFRETDRVFRLVYSAVKNALLDGGKRAFFGGGVEDGALGQRQDQPKEEIGEGLHKIQTGRQHSFQYPIPDSGLMPQGRGVGEHSSVFQMPEAQPVTAEDEVQFGGVEVLGQVLGTYIVGRTKEGLFLMDQHSAHEALLFKMISQELDEKGYIASQRLAFPIVLSLEPQEVEGYSEKKEELQRLGFETDLFGEEEIAVRTVPTVLALHEQRDEVIRDLIRKALGPTPVSLKDILYDISSKAACKRAVKAGDRLEAIEMEKLVDECLKEGITHCPHGRPVFVLLGVRDLEALFKRL